MSGYNNDDNKKMQEKAAELLIFLQEQQQKQAQAQAQAQAQSQGQVVNDTDTVNNKVKNNAIQSVNVKVDLDILFVIIFLIFNEGNDKKSFNEDTIAKAMAMVKSLKN